MPHDHTPLWHAVGAGGTDKILSQHFKHGRAAEPRDHASRHGGERQGGHDQMADQVENVAATIDRIHAADRQPPQVHREKKDHHHAQKEGWHRNADQHDESDGLVGEAVLAGG